MKRLLNVLLIASLFMMLFSMPTLAAEYTDTIGHPASEAIQRWSDLSVIQGFEGRFRPDDGIIRGEMALIIDRIMLYQRIAENSFSDLPNTWYTEAMLKLNAADVMFGAFGEIRPEDNITREEALVMIARSVGMSEPMHSMDSLPYEDAANISEWSLPAVINFTSRGFITDSPIVFRPQEYITRAEVVVILHNVIQQLWRTDGLYNKAVTGNAVVAGKNVLLINSDIDGDLIIAGGGTQTVILKNCVIKGSIINKSEAAVLTAPERYIFFGDKELPLWANVPTNDYRGRDFFYEEYRGGSGERRTHYDSGSQRSVTGIDVSEHQEVINWEQVAADGIDFAFIRAGYRGYTAGKLSEDIYFHQNMQGAIAAGLDVGIYFFSQAITPMEAIEEARMTLDLVSRYSLQYPIVFDWEPQNNADSRTKDMPVQLLTDCAKAFCQTIEMAGHEPMIYHYSQLAYEGYDLSQLADYDFWYASRTATPEFYYGFDIWQYTSTGAVAGIKGDVDINIEFVEY